MESNCSKETYFSHPSNHQKIYEEPNSFENVEIEPYADRTSITTTKYQWERTFPNISYLINQKDDWNALFRVLKLTEETINKRGIYHKGRNKKDIDDMQRVYKEWWTLLRSTHGLYEGNVRKLSKLFRAFVIAAMDEPSHTIRIRHVTAAAKEQAKKMNQPSLKSYTKSFQESSFQAQSPRFQTTSTTVHEKTINLENGAKSPQAISSKSTRFSKDFPRNISRLKLTQHHSTIMSSKRPDSSISLPSSLGLPWIADIPPPPSTDGSKENLTAHVTASPTEQEETYYMKVILKDILKAITIFMGGQEGTLGKGPKRFPKSSGHGGNLPRRFTTHRYSTHPPPTPLLTESPSVPMAASLVRKTKKGMSDGQKAVNEINRLRHGLWPMLTRQRFPTALHNLNNFHIKKSLLVPQERAKRLLCSNNPSAYKSCVRDLGSKRYGNPVCNAYR